MLRSIGAPASIVLAWAGMAVHDALELPDLVPASPEFLVPTAIYAIAGAAFLRTGSRVSAMVLGGWTLLNLVGGGILSVLPLPIFPFAPEQSVGHYVAHAFYAVTQVPLLWITWRAASHRYADQR
jgi:hypothetical protein